jgi:serine/threonine protein kinase
VNAESGWIHDRAIALTNEPPGEPLVVWEDTTNYMSIERGHIIRLSDGLFLVRCSEREGRFGIDEQPKFWVKRAIELADGRTYILKLACVEEFRIHVGVREVRCFRSAEKEARVLELVRGDSRFMQGHTAFDGCGNRVHVIEFVHGTDLLTWLHSLPMPHEEYSHQLLPGILGKIAGCFAGIQVLHDAGLCHGDIRNDHLLIDRTTGCYKWIDFDLNESSPWFDVWSAGNILHCVTAKGFVTFREVIHSHNELSGRLSGDDASVFFPNRVMNLRKVYPYLPEKLNEILSRFSAGARTPYDRMGQIVEDLEACVASMS